MMNRPPACRPLDLLVRAANGPEQELPPPIRAEVTLLLKLLLAEWVGDGVAQPIGAVANE